MAEYNMPQYILREFKVTDARVGVRGFVGEKKIIFDIFKIEEMILFYSFF